MSRRGVVLREVAAAVEKGVSTVGSWTQGKNWPEAESLIILGRFLHVSLDYLVSGTAVTAAGPTKKSDHLILGGKITAVSEGDSGIYGEVASRIPEQRNPSTRADCESYTRRLFDAAELSEDPDAFPAIMSRLKKQFPLDEWDAPTNEK